MKGMKKRMMHGLLSGTKGYRRGVAFVLALAMIMVNTLTGTISAYAEESQQTEGTDTLDVRCELNAEEVNKAIGKVMERVQKEADQADEIQQDMPLGLLYDLDVRPTLTPGADVDVNLLYDVDCNDVVVQFTNQSEGELAFQVVVCDPSDGEAIFESETVTVPGIGSGDEGIAGGADDEEMPVDGQQDTENEITVSPENFDDEVNDGGSFWDESGEDESEQTIVPATPGNGTDVGEGASEGDDAGDDEIAAPPEVSGDEANSGEVVPDEPAAGDGEIVTPPEVPGDVANIDEASQDGTNVGDGTTMSTDLPGGDMIKDDDVDDGSMDLDAEARSGEIRISGEVFGFDGVMMMALDDGAVTLKNGEEIKGHYATLDEAIGKVEAGDVIEINENLYNVAVTTDKAFTLELNDNTLYADGIHPVLTIDAGSGSVEISHGTISGPEDGTNKTWGLLINSASDVILDNVAIKKCGNNTEYDPYSGSSNGALKVICAYINMTECYIEDNYATSDVVFIKASQGEISKCEFMNNSMFSLTRGSRIVGDNTVCAYGGDIKFSECIFKGNKMQQCGGLSVDNKANVTVDECEFSDNEVTDGLSDIAAGAIVVRQNATLAIDNKTIMMGNTSAKGAGAIYDYGSTLEISGGTRITQNTGKTAGAIYHRTGSLKINETIITDNKVDEKSEGVGSKTNYNAGGIYVDSKEFYLYSGAVYGNNAGNDAVDIMFGTSSLKYLMAASEMESEEIGNDLYVWQDLFDEEKYYYTPLYNNNYDYYIGSTGIRAIKSGERGTLVINKTVEGVEEDEAVADKTFSFDIKDESGNIKTVNIIGEGMASTGLAPGTYTITEQEKSTVIEGYTLLGTTIESKVIEVKAGDTKTVNIVNQYEKKKPRKLKIKVNITGDIPDDLIPEKFRFTYGPFPKYTDIVEIPSGRKPEMEIEIDVSSLTNGVSVKEAPEGEGYSKQVDGYSCKLISPKAGFCYGLVKEGDTLETEFTFEYTKIAEPGNLRIKLEIDGEIPKDQIPAEYSFNCINATDPKVEKTGTITIDSSNLNQETVIESLPVGKYRVEELAESENHTSANVDGYGLKVQSEPNIVEVKEGETAEITITNTYTKDCVMVGQKTYNSLAAAFEKVPIDEEFTDVIVLRDIELGAGTSLKKGQNVRLISDEGETYRICRSEDYKNCMIKVESGAELTITNITLDGGYDTEKDNKARQSLIKVDAGGTLNIDSGATLENNNISSETGVNVLGGFPSVGTDYSFNGGAVWCEGTVNMNGGNVTNCVANNGGGILLFGNGKENTVKFVMNGGEISGNTATFTGNGRYDYDVGSGGGVCIVGNAQMEFYDGIIRQNYSGYGGGISLGVETGQNTNIHETGLLMGEEANNKKGKMIEGAVGTIKENESKANGGGIFIAEGYTAKIFSGEIVENECTLDEKSYSDKSRSALYGGGGIYVQGGRGSTGKLWLNNVRISDNSAALQGGGIAGCPYSSVCMYIDDGGVIYNNNQDSGEYPGQEIYVTRNKDSIPTVRISSTMLRGGEYGWKDAEGNILTPSELNVTLSGEHSSIGTYNELTDSDESVQEAEEYVTTVIAGNRSNSCGGGIGTNGEVNIGKGEPKDELVSIWVRKLWDGEADKNANLRANSIKLWLLQNGERFVSVDLIVSDYGKYWNEGAVEFFKGLPKYEPDGETEYVYTVEEDFNGAYIITTDPGEANNEDKPWTFTNTPTCSLRLEKQAVNGGTNEEFTFILSLTDETGLPFEGKVDVVDDDGKGLEPLEFVDGKAEIRLKSGEYKYLTGLKNGMTYQIEESDARDAVSTSYKVTETLTEQSGEQRSSSFDGTNCGGTTKYGRIDVVCTNKFEEPSKPSEPESNPSQPETQPSEPETNPSQPETQPSESETQPSEPETQPSEPSSENPTEPTTQPTESETSPTEPYTPPRNPGNPPSTPTPPTMPVTNIPEEAVPLSPSPLVNIEDEDVPLAFMAPSTGDEKPVGAVALFSLLALGLMGAFGILAFKKDENDA